MSAGLPLIVMDRDVPTDKTLFIGQSNVTMAEGVAEKMAKDLGGKGNIVVITGLKGSSAAVDRDKGMKNVLAKYPDIKILATGDGQWIRDPSVPIMEDFLTAYPKIDAVFSHAEESSWGAQLAIARGNHCKDDIKHYTFDGSNAGVQGHQSRHFPGGRELHALHCRYRPESGDLQAHGQGHPRRAGLPIPRQGTRSSGQPDCRYRRTLTSGSDGAGATSNQPPTLARDKPADRRA